MTTDDELVEIKERAAAQLMAVPSVTAVGIGGRERGGEPTGELVLKVYLAHKLPADQVDPAELVPAEFEGVPTDVSELLPSGRSSTDTPVTAPPGKPEVPVDKADTDRHRPVVGGGALAADIGVSGFGTLGCMMVTPGDPTKVYALTNWLLFTADGAKTPVVGTTKVGEPTADDSITKCCSSSIGKVAGGGRDATRDAGLALLVPAISRAMEPARPATSVGRRRVGVRASGRGREGPTVCPEVTLDPCWLSCPAMRRTIYLLDWTAWFPVGSRASMSSARRAWGRFGPDAATSTSWRLSTAPFALLNFASFEPCMSAVGSPR